MPGRVQQEPRRRVPPPAPVYSFVQVTWWVCFLLSHTMFLVLFLWLFPFSLPVRCSNFSIIYGIFLLSARLRFMLSEVYFRLCIVFFLCGSGVVPARGPVLYTVAPVAIEITRSFTILLGLRK